jgi:pimeloyl-ACP methyl ester carboxylesterase
MAKDIAAPGIESLFTEIKGRRIHYLKAGQGQPVVLLHGGASDARDWLPAIEKIGGGYAFYAPDMPGFGESDRDPKGYYLTDYAEFLLDFITQLKLDRPAAAGHSLGGRVCLDAALLPGNNISKLILIDASGFGKISPFGGFLFNFFKWLRDVQRKPQPFPRFLVKEGVDWNTIGEEALKSIKIPALMIWKGFDPYMSLAKARRAQKMIPRAKLEIIPGYGHAPHKQKDNSTGCRLIGEFLDGRDG